MSQLQEPSNPFNYPVNPSFGKGSFHRRLRLQKGEDRQGLFVFGELEDCNHGFQCKVYYDEQQVLDIQALHKRIPLSTCAGAKQPLQALIGTPLDLTAKELQLSIDPQENCTHWLDLSILCIQHARRDEAECDYLIEIPDETDQPTTASIFKNGTLILSWLIQDWQILEPQHLAGNTLYKGFASWANQEFSTQQDLLEAAFILQKGYFVSKARRFDLQKLAGEPASNHEVMHGACYSYSEPRLSEAVRTKDSVRDFSDCPEQLLAFK